MAKKKLLKFGCPFCGSELIWGSDEDSINARCDVAEDDCSIISYYSCPNCGCDVEVYECLDEDKKDYPFWDKK